MSRTISDRPSARRIKPGFPDKFDPSDTKDYSSCYHVVHSAWKSFVGKKIGRLTILRLGPPDSRAGSRWICSCECGSTIITRKDNLRDLRSCGCLHVEYARRQGLQNINRRGPGTIAEENIAFARYRISAKKRNLEFGLTIEEFRKIIKQDCHYCGGQPSGIWKTHATLGTDLIYNGIDRVDSSIGYVTSNMVPCCKTCNYMKRMLSVDEFLSHVRRICAHNLP